MSGIGHNGGPAIEGGKAWRKHCWTAAREALLPTLPVEVVRLRVKRAREIGLDYRTYAGLRATTGRDVVALLFSTNALELLTPADRLDIAKSRKLGAVTDTARLLAAQPPLSPSRVAAMLEGQGVNVHGAIAAPGVAESWAQTRNRIAALLADSRHPPDGVVLIGETALERDWVAAARLAGFVPGHAYFVQG